MEFACRIVLKFQHFERQFAASDEERTATGKPPGIGRVRSDKQRRAALLICPSMYAPSIKVEDLSPDEHSIGHVDLIGGGDDLLLADDAARRARQRAHRTVAEHGAQAQAGS